MFSKNKLLLIEPFTALPQTSGGKTRIFHTIIELQKYFSIDLLSFFNNTSEKSLQDDWLAGNDLTAEYFEINAKKFFSFLKTGQPYWFSDWFNSKLIVQLKQKDFSSYQRIIVEFTQLLYLVKYLPKNSSIQKIFVAHDISSFTFWRRLVAEKNYLKKLVGFFRFLEVYFYERQYLPKFNLVIAVSDHDAAILRAQFGLKNVKVISNAISAVNILPITKKSSDLSLGYIGSFSHTPNFEAVKFIFNKILPQLEKQNIKYNFYLAGDNPTDLFEKLIADSPIKNYSSITNLGRVGNLADFYQKIDLLIAPIFAGSGTRIKILESLSFGRPVLTTTIGAEGINLHTSLLKIIDERNGKNSKIWLEEIVKFFDQEKILTSELEKLKTELAKLTWERVFKENQL